MEITSFSSPNPNPPLAEDYSQLYTPLISSEFELNTIGHNPLENSKKRRKIDSTFFGDNSFKEMFGKLLLLDEEDKAYQDRIQTQQENNSFFDTIYNNTKPQAMTEEDDIFYQSNHHNEVNIENERDQVGGKRDFASIVVGDNLNVPTVSFNNSTLTQTTSSGGNGSCGGGGGQQGQQQQQQQRRLWVKDRSKEWWEQCNSPDFPEEEFRGAFRMSKATFDMICEELDSVVTKKDTTLRLAIPVRQRVAVCIWRLATGEPLREVSKRFGLGISTCHKLVLEVCHAIRNVLMPKFVQWPQENKLNCIKEAFESISGIPNVGGSMHTTHIPIIAPKNNVGAYFNKRHTERNQKTSYSTTVQGVVDPNGVFTDLCIGWPGSMSDDKVLQKSALYQRAKNGLLKDTWIVGNSGYPLMDWVLVPYAHQNLTWTQHAFNEKCNLVQRASKEAFMRLKGRWRCFQKRTEVKLQDLPVLLGACCVLHNICEMRNEEFDAELRFELFDDEMVPENGVRSVSAMQTRDQLAHNLLHYNLAGTSFL